MKQQANTVSVVILNYNGREHLEACLSSLLELEFPKDQLETIVVDNGSTDGSAELVESRFPAVRLIRSEVNLGFSKAANLGAANAKGDYVAFLNNDMRADKDWLRVLVETARSGNGSACAGSKVMNWDGTGVDFSGRPDDAFCLAYSRSNVHAPAESASTAHRPTLFVSGGAAIFERLVFQEVGGFDPDFFLYHEDVDLGWRLSLRGYKCVLSPESVVYHRGGATSGKLPGEYIQALSQKHALASVFKNLEAENLREFLPFLFYFLLERSRWVPAARKSLAAAIREFQSSLDSLIAKRRDVQRTRVRSDQELFARLGHPFGFLLRDESYEPIRRELDDCSSGVGFDPNEPDSARAAITEWMNNAHFLYESRLTEELDQRSAGEARAPRDVSSRADDMSALDSEIRRAAAVNETLRARLEDAEKLIRVRDETIAGLQDERRGTLRENRLLSAELSERTEHLDRITRSLGWRLLNRYGQLKYAYLLPVYRLLGLPPYGRKVRRPGATAEVGQAGRTSGECAEGVETEQTHVSQVSQRGIPVESNAYDVICFPIIDWDFRFQRPQQLMSRFAAAGHRVFYLSQRTRFSGAAYTVQEKSHNILEVSLRGPELNVYTGSLDGAACEELFESLDSLRRDLSLGATAVFVQLPFWWPLAGRMRAKFGWPIVYDCMDYHAGFSTNGKKMLDQEEALMSSVDLVIASSAFLENEARRHNSRVAVVRNGCDAEHFARADKPRGARPVIGYYGAIAEWFDSDLVADLAERRPDWDFVLVGSTFSSRVGRLTRLSNVRLPGEKPYSEIPDWLDGFDVAIIPFKRTPLTEATNPVKAYEILAAGKPLVSVPIPEMAALSPLVRLASTAAEFENGISAALEENEPEREQRRAFAKENTWENRHAALAPLVCDTFPKASIIVVTFNNLHLNRLCLESIYARTEWPNFEVIVVDNASSDGTPDYLRQAQSTFPNLCVILNDANLGFAAANNIGLGQATGAYLVLLNNDTVVTRGWLSTLIRHLHTNPEIGLIGPVSNAVGNEAKVDVGYTQLDEMPEWAANYVREHDGQVFPIPMLAMFCVALRREVFEKVGRLDEQFGIGMFEDDDYSMRIKLGGFRVACAADVFVHHFGQAAFRKLMENGEYHKLFDENRRRYEKKWNVEWVPHQYRLLRFEKRVDSLS